MKKLIALAAATLSLAIGAPAMAQMERHSSTTVTTPSGQTMTRTMDREGGSRVVTRRVVRTERRVVHHGRRCVTRWVHHRRVKRCTRY